MKTTVLILFVSFLTVAAPVSAQRTGADIVRLCEARLAASAGAPPDIVQAYEYGKCEGFIAGVGTGFYQGVELGRTMLTGVCVPADVTDGQIWRLVVRDGVQRAEELHVPASEFVLRSIALAFPCPEEAADDVANALKAATRVTGTRP